METTLKQCEIQVEDVFGPQVSGCYENFDFTLLFEESVLYLAPLLVTSFLVSLRLWQMRSKEKLVRWSVLWILKQLVHLVLSLVLKTSTTRLSNAVIIIGFLASPIFAFLSHREHYRSARPSTILTVYFLGTIPMDAARARTLLRMPGNRAIGSIFTTIVCCKLILLVLEAKEKRKLMSRCFPPEQTAGILNRSFFWWLNPLLLAGYKQSLTADELLTVDDGIALEEWQEKIRDKWANAVAKEPRSLLKVILTVYYTPLLAGILPRLCLTGLNYAQPFLVNRVVNFMGEPNTTTSNEVAYGLIAAYAIDYIGIAVMSTMFQHKSYRALVMVRGGVVLLIYDHTLSLNVSSTSESTSLTLINADVERIGSGLRNVHEIWASVIEIGLSLWLLKMKIGVSTVAAAAVVVVCILANARFGRLLGGRQKIWLEAIEARITTTVTAIGTIKGMKATGSTNILDSIISKLRADEILSSIKFREVLIALVTLSYVSSTMAPVFAFGTYSLLSKIRHTTPLTAATAYTSLTILTLLGQAVSVFIDAAMGLRQAVTSLERVRRYLASEARIDSRNSSSTYVCQSAPPTEPTTSDESWTEMRNVSSPEQSPSKPNNDRLIVLRNCSASWEKDSKPVIVDINVAISRGSFAMVIGPVGSGKSTLLKTILGETPYTTGAVMVQKAEAAFCGQTAWLTNTTIRNNILGVSRLDAQWYNTVVKACTLDQDFTQLPDGDNSIIGSKGILLSGGQKSRLALARALYARETLVILDDVFSGLDAKTEQTVFSSLFGPDGILRQGDTTTVLATNSIRNVSLADYIIVLGPDGTIAEQGMYKDLACAGGYLESLDPRERENKTVDPVDEAEDPALRPTALRGANLTADHQRLTDLTIYKYYIDMIGWVTWWIFVLLCSGFVFGLIFSQIWIKFWTEANARKANDRLGYYLSLYALWSVMAITIFLGACLHLMLNLVPKAAKEFHGALLKTVLSAPLVFFSTTDNGEISNRFSQDLELIDMELPIAIIGTTITFLLCIGQMAVVIYSSKYVAATIPGLMILDLEAKAPLLSHFMETIQGLIAVRAFGWTRQYTSRHDNLLGKAQQPLYLLYCAQLWLNLTLDMIVAFLAIILVSIAVTTTKSSGALIGLALSNIVGFGINLKGLIYNWTSLEIAMGAIARVRLFTSNTPCENQPGEDGTPPPTWPERGMVRFDNVSSSYDSISPPVVNHVSFVVQPGEKLAICGRTGSGKSSLVSTLLRLLDLRSGTITIDGVDISTISRQDVRSKLITLPQEPFFYHASIRENLDINGQSFDEDLFEVLKMVGLHEVILKKGGLDVLMSDDLLSHGQKQLLCLARAMLQPSKILILDEATSSVDQKTEAMMLEIIRERFHDHTVICIAHKLNTIMDYDEVIVLDEGRIVERGKPNNLASEPSIFASLLRAAGDYSDVESEDEYIPFMATGRNGP
uniref:TRT n=1 Tax=Phialomyces arenicola TaxID=168477 RepID=A0A6H0XBG5_9EURO|nr:TRT [Phialomyces arenicola]